MAGYSCEGCGYKTPKWMGKCPECNSWGTLYIAKPQTSSNAAAPIPMKHFQQVSELNTARMSTGITEMDRVLGGGMVAGSSILISGEPGIGKSTLIMQIAAKFEGKALYISGEESLEQLSLRANRLGVIDKKVYIASTNDLENILYTIANHDNFQIVIIDSIQTIFSKDVHAYMGSINQVRQCTQELITKLKSSGILLIIVGHITKDGQISGPKLLEHMVDAVLYFESDEKNHYRLLRAAKNRFGDTDEIGMFEMLHNGLKSVVNPSAIFMQDVRNDDDHTAISGTAITACLSGSRPIMIEVHSLITQSMSHNPKRSVVGWDLNRLSMILAVLQSRCKINTATKEVYLNIAGGLKIQEPAADLSVSAAIISEYYRIPIPKCIILGEITLSGEIKPIVKVDIRIKESAKLGFKNFIIPECKISSPKGTYIRKVRHISELVKIIKSKKIKEELQIQDQPTC